MTKRKTKKVEGWDERYGDPFRIYQNILEKYVKKKVVDEEEKEFFAEVERMIKTGELKVLRPGQEGYDEFLIQLIQEKYPNNPFDWFKHRDTPQWFRNYLREMQAWVAQNSEKTELDYQVENKVGFTWFSDEHDQGKVILWENEKSKTFTMLKYS